MLYFAGLLLYSCGHLLQRWENLVAKNANTWAKILSIPKKLLNVVHLSGNVSISTIQDVRNPVQEIKQKESYK